GDVEIEEVLAILKENVQLAQHIIRRSIEYFPEGRSCKCATSLKDAIITERARIPKKTRRDLKPIVGKYL
ncbi:MAG: S-methyl-5'-thioadenosine phosphorylase, partial [Candidatus Binatia bacterium]